MPAAVWKKRRRLMPCFLGQPVAEGLEPGLDLALLLGLPRREIFVARDDLGRDRRGEGGRFRRCQQCELVIAQETPWSLPPL